MNSAEDFSSRACGGGFEDRFPPFCAEGALNSLAGRIGEGAVIWRSREELEELYAAGLGEVMVRTWPEVLLCDRG